MAFKQRYDTAKCEDCPFYAGELFGELYVLTTNWRFLLLTGHSYLRSARQAYWTYHRAQRRGGYR